MSHVILILVCACPVSSQSSTGTIHGTVTDQNNAAIVGASAAVRNTQTGFSRSMKTSPDGYYRFENIPTGTYEITVEAANFTRYIRRIISLDVNQTAVADVTLAAGDIREIVTVIENASLLNTSTAEVATRFDERRLSELPTSPNRSVLSVLHSVPGIGQLGPGQTSLATGLTFSVNGGRVRSNNFMLDGQDINDTVFSGTGSAPNNPDAVQEVRIVTNQFRAEYGRNSGSVVNIVGKSGTNEYHGSLFWYHNNEYLNSCSNLDKVASFAPTGFCDPNAATKERTRAPKRRENQVGLTLGGPLTFPWFGDGGGPTIWKGTDRTFFFGDYQRWLDRSQNSGATLRGAPTVAGRAVLQSVALDRPHVQALLDFVPAGTPNGAFAVFTIAGESPRLVELGDLTGSTPFVFDDRQGSVRIDHRLNEKNLIYGRYRGDAQRATGGGQVTPPGLTTVNSSRSDAATLVLNSIFANRFYNAARASLSRFRSATDAEDPRSKSIPSMDIRGLEMTGGTPSSRTAFGFPSNLPGGRRILTHQISDAVSYVAGDHTLKFGVELRRTDTRIAAFLNARGRLQYNSPPPVPGQPVNISSFVNDVASVANINFPLAGGETVASFRWYELYAFAQDEWRLGNNLTLTYGIRYEFPGDTFRYLAEVNDRILAANGNDPAFRVASLPKADTNNFMPRLGFSWNLRTKRKGLLRIITGGDKLVIRGGYSRAYDASLMNLNANMFYSFPFTATQNIPPNGAFAVLRNTTAPSLLNPNRLDRTIVSTDFRAPAADQLSLDFQRELTSDLLAQVGYIRTRGTGLMQTIDGNPCIPGRICTAPNLGNRLNPALEVVRLYANAAASTYNAMHMSLTKRLSNNFSAGLHYTWSVLIDDASDVFGTSTSEVSIAQDPFDRRSERARSSYDRPHRLTGNFVYEFPFDRQQNSVAGRLVGGWQLSAIFTIQSGAPFSVSLGSDPLCAVCGLATTVRPNLNTDLDISRMTIGQLLAAGGVNLFTGLFPGQRVGNAGRNILRADGFRLADIGIVKNTTIATNIHAQFRVELFNAFNWRNFGIPPASLNNQSFLDQWSTHGGNRRIRLAVRLVF